jgi:hypothetical protein
MNAPESFWLPCFVGEAILSESTTKRGFERNVKKARLRKGATSASCSEEKHFLFLFGGEERIVKLDEQVAQCRFRPFQRANCLPKSTTKVHSEKIRRREQDMGFGMRDTAKVSATVSMHQAVEMVLPIALYLGKMSVISFSAQADFRCIAVLDKNGHARILESSQKGSLHCLAKIKLSRPLGHVLCMDSRAPIFAITAGECSSTILIFLGANAWPSVD